MELFENGTKRVDLKFHSDYLLRDSIRHTGHLRMWPPTDMASTDFGHELERLRGKGNKIFLAHKT